MKKTLTCAALLILALGTLLWAEPTKKPLSPTKTAPTPAPSGQPAQAAAPAALPTPLPAERFQGHAREAYKAAAEMPDVLAGLACYCGCDKSYGHRNLLDCFVDEHGAGCGHCMNEALDAQALFMAGTPPEEIRKFIDNKYGPK
jgi:hypothetical protein